MRLFILIFLSVFCEDDGDSEWDNNDEIKPTFEEDIIEKYGELGWNQFRKIYKDLDPSMKSKLHEHYRALKRDCFNFGKCRKRNKKSAYIAGKRLFSSNILEYSLWNTECPEVMQLKIVH